MEIKMKGIDVSSWNGKIDWKRVKADGIDFAMIRCGFGSESPNQIDKQFINNIKGAIQNNIAIGIYHFSYATNPDKAREEADFCLSLVNDFKENITFPIAYDFEYDSLVNNPLDKKEITDCVIAFCERIKENGYTPCLYTNYDFIKNRLEMSRLTKYSLWLSYPNSESPQRNCDIWQWSFTGAVDGISGNVDLNYAYTDFAVKNENNNSNIDEACEYIDYKVKKGDTLWNIAEDFLGNGLRYPEIKKLNNIESDIIYPDMILKVPKEIRYISYKIKTGDTLWDIAAKYTGNGKNYIQIMKANRLENDVIFPGTVLKIPVD